ncbi:MAG TPA: YHS domain-containing protein [Bacteroidia bacterium]|jgi:YHS domain-containing protein|nr:YHS domain-containing protein [Bacteroidia bacterium]
MQPYTKLIKTGAVGILLYLGSCNAAQKLPNQTYLDIVCGMNVEKSEAYTSKYKGVTYYFDTYNCKHVFSMDPDKFISNQCVPPNPATK